MNIIRNFSIRYKLIFIVLLVSIPTLITGFSIIIFMDVVKAKKQIVDSTIYKAQNLAYYLATPLTFENPSGANEVINVLSHDKDVVSCIIFDKKNLPFAFYPRGKKLDAPVLPSVDVLIYNIKDDSLLVFQPIIADDNKIGTLYLKVSTIEMQQNMKSRIFYLLSILPGLFLLVYFLALRLQRMISQPILKLANVTEHISNKPDLSVRVQKVGNDEIGVLYDGFNNMMMQIQSEHKKRDEAQTELQRLMRQLEDKNKELEQVIYVTSHDLRSPLVNIQGFSQELGFSLKEVRKYIDSAECIENLNKRSILKIIETDVAESLKYIETSTVKMDLLLSGLLKLSRVDRTISPFDTINMNQLIDDIIAGFEFQVKEADVEIHVDILPSCFGNEIQLNQAFSNLISNALKYLDPSRGGKIIITGSENQEKNEVIYCVEDNGIGIQKEYHKKIFEIFHRLNPDKSEGDGLGLAIVSKIVNRHKGNIWVESEPGKGSKFYLSFPIHE